MPLLPTTEITGRTSTIPGLIIFAITYVGDARGYFQEKYQQAKLVAAGMPADFRVVQTSLAYNQPVGVTRGFHAEPWDKYISLVTGRGFAAFLDLRRGETFGTVVSVTLTPTTAVFVPQGVANSFQSLQPDTYYLYNVNAHWSAANYDRYSFVSPLDSSLGVEWPIPLDRAALSDRDRNHPRLRDIEPMDVPTIS